MTQISQLLPLAFMEVCYCMDLELSNEEFKMLTTYSGHYSRYACCCYCRRCDICSCNCSHSIAVYLFCPVLLPANVTPDETYGLGSKSASLYTFYGNDDRHPPYTCLQVAGAIHFASPHATRPISTALLYDVLHPTLVNTGGRPGRYGCGRDCCVFRSVVPKHYISTSNRPGITKHCQFR